MILIDLSNDQSWQNTTTTIQVLLPSLLFAFGDTISAPLDVIFFERIC